MLAFGAADAGRCFDVIPRCPVPFWALTYQLRCCIGSARKLADFFKNILICVPKMNEGLTGLERHEGE